MGEKYKKACKYSNYVKHLLILASRVTACVSISPFAPFVAIPAFTYSAFGSFTKYREIIQKFRAIGNSKHLYKDELNNVFFAHDEACSDRKDLAKRTISDKILKDRALEIARNRGYDGYKRALASVVYKIFDKKTGARVNVK